MSLSRQNPQTVLSASGMTPRLGAAKVQRARRLSAPCQGRSRAKSRASYRALSYTWDQEYTTPWGRLERKKTIICNGKKLTVGDNLYLALQNLRARPCQTPIWIDGICINQADEAGKSFQVRIMDRIYSQAALVHVWLGEGLRLSFSATVMKWIEANCGKSRVDEGRDREDQSALSAPRNLYWVEIDEVLAWLNRVEDRREGIGVAELIRDVTVETQLPYLFCLRWFTRVWVLQEAILARELEFSFGDCTVTEKSMFEALERAIELQRKKIAKHPAGIQSYQDYENELLMHLHSIRIMFEMRRIRTLEPDSDSDSDQTTNLHYMLLGWNRRAKRAHDKVYGLLGLILGESGQASGLTSLVVDYKIPAETVFAVCT